MKSLKFAALAAALAASTDFITVGHVVEPLTESDPYKPKRRSKGEKARNRKNRGYP